MRKWLGIIGILLFVQLLLVKLCLCGGFHAIEGRLMIARIGVICFWVVSCLDVMLLMILNYNSRISHNICLFAFFAMAVLTFGLVETEESWSLSEAILVLSVILWFFGNMVIVGYDALCLQKNQKDKNYDLVNKLG
jgi:hypothetical protein